MNLRDLFVVIADLDAENVIGTLLSERQRALGVRLDFNPRRHPTGDLLRYAGRDSGCYKDAVDVLRPPQRTHRHALIVFDMHGCGVNGKSREEIETDVEERLYENGWRRGAAAAVVIQPELEAWVWSASSKVADALGWKDDRAGLREFLSSLDLWKDGCPKPHDPKEAMRQSLRSKRRPLGAQLFTELASKVSVNHCEDAAFQKFNRTLVNWFGVGVLG